MSLIALYTACASEYLMKHAGLVVEFSLFFGFVGLSCLVCFDLSRKLSLRVIAIGGISGWILTFALSVWYIYWSKQ
jgi:hypothetical protein